jgi:hypothetical protein
VLRVVVDVTDLGGVQGWQVRIRLPADTDPGGVPLEPYAMRAVHVPETVGTRRVPQPEHLPPVDAKHRAVCDGDVAAVSDLLARIRSRSTRPDDVFIYGRWLFECLLAPAWDPIVHHPAAKAACAVEVALRWPANASDLHRLAWESMHDGTAALAGHASRLVAISRLVPAQVAAVQTIVDVPRLLFAAGPDLYDDTIRPGAMYMGLLRAMDAEGSCLARAIHRCSLPRLKSACVEFQPHAVHLVAHGVLVDGQRGALVLQDDEPVDANDLVSAVTAGGNLTAVVLSACNTGLAGDPPADPVDASPLAAQLVEAGVPLVSAMAGEISEPACRLYTRRLVSALLEGRSIVEASAHGRRAALMDASHTNGDIDWALPALFVAESTDQSARVVDATQARRVISIANTLGLRQEPVFIGRQPVLEDADRLLHADGDIGVMGILASGSTSRLGGTRLLREVGWRLLRGGHVPLLLGPFASGGAPTSLRKLVAECLSAALRVSETLDVAPLVPLVLEADARSEPLAERVAGLPSIMARMHVRREIAQFAVRSETLEPGMVRDLLSDDLRRLACLAAAAGPPFGTHSRAVVLCDDVHEWVDGLAGLLAMLSADGLGRPNHRVPVILTGSRTADDGARLAAWSGKNGLAGFRFYHLDELSQQDRLIGYQWVLLHPWLTRSAEDDIYRRTYTIGPRPKLDMSTVFKSFSGEPAWIATQLFPIAHALAQGGGLHSDDDEQAFSAYAALHPEYKLL